VKHQNARLIALLHGPDRPGLVASVATWIHEAGGNILHAEQHRDSQAGVFFQRLEWTVPEGAEAAHERGFVDFANKLGMDVRLHGAAYRPRVVVMVSKLAHCFHDLMLRFQSAELPGEVVGIVSNHPDLEAASAGYGAAFVHTPVSAQNKPEAEARQIQWIVEQRAELVVMARYMQVLSAQMLEQIGCPVINIHHSFLPAFAGGRPYHQAHARGVKLIGATAHYATADLDEGPIIAQDVVRISHRHDPSDLIRLGRDLEKTVLARAVRSHLQHRILPYQNKTVVFG
jgi:formyltetrahydrofolate deformylase